ncbi:MAG TPA: type II secretion system protein [Pseudonocardiaceae bacterium]|nr:type II secretion system protein [Pseudonocardiaceae bacterium]
MARPADDRGETLLEVLIAVVIMGIAIVAIIGGLVTSVLLSDVHRKQATAGAAVRDYAETIEKYAAAGNYVPCATAASYAAGSVGFTKPTGYTPAVNAVAYWNGSGWVSGCGTDLGLQQLKVQVASDDTRANEQLTIVVRKRCGLADTLC